MTGPATDRGKAPAAPPGSQAHRARYLQGRRRNLLEQLTADAIASDYPPLPPEQEGTALEPDASQEAVDSAQARRAARIRRQQIVVAASGLGLAGFVLAVGLSSRISNEPIINEQRTALAERVTQADATQAKVGAEVAKLRQKVEKARIRALDLTAAGVIIGNQIRDLELVTGYSEVSGPGVTVTMKDAEPKDGVDPDLSKVLDTDIQQAVNGLWYSGAEAVAINGQRLSARSAIRSAAGAILVNYRPLRPPYLIEAIGDPDELLTKFQDSPDAKALQGVSKQFGIGFTASAAEKLDLPAASGRLPDQAVVVEPGSKGSKQEGKR